MEQRGGKSRQRNRQRLATRQRSPRKASARTSVDPPEQEVRQRAYDIYLERAGAPGDPGKDWLEAERRLREEKRTDIEGGRRRGSGKGGGRGRRK